MKAERAARASGITCSMGKGFVSPQLVSAEPNSPRQLSKQL